MAKSAKSSRGRKPAPDDERKDKVIQTRVPRELESSLKEAAERERVPVSQLIRNVLADSFQLVDSIVADSSQLVENVTRDARRIALSASGDANEAGDDFVPARDGGQTAQALLDAVDSWQDVIVNRPDRCVYCGTGVQRGQRAFRGLMPEAGGPVVWLCSECIEQL